MFALLTGHIIGPQSLTERAGEKACAMHVCVNVCVCKGVWLCSIQAGHKLVHPVNIPLFPLLD